MKLYSIWSLKHMPEDFLSHTKPCNWGQKSCQSPQNSLKTFQSNEVRVWPSYASLRTAIVLPHVHLSKRHSDLKQKLLNFWMAAHDSNEGKKSNRKLEESMSSLAVWIEDARGNTKQFWVLKNYSKDMDVKEKALKDTFMILLVIFLRTQKIIYDINSHQISLKKLF